MGNFEIKEFRDDEVPPYAILSHTWGDGEVTLQDMNTFSAMSKNGYGKISQCCHIARVNGLDYVWIDTCCIDKTSSAELSEAINSMYRWYQEAVVCYAYLADVPSKKAFEDNSWRFKNSRWFTRGWTLQELIAPSKVVFFGDKWKKLGDKTGLQQTISDCTDIPVSVLSGADDLDTFSVAQRMSWAAKRQTSRIEDRAYCLMGIFGVNMPLIYGERETSFIRLQEEIMRILDDHSLFAWRAKNQNGLLAKSPAAFISSHNIVQSNPFNTLNNPLTMSSRGIHLDVRFIGIGHRALGLVVLHCKQEGSDKFIAIYVRDLFFTLQQFRRVQTEKFELVDLKKFRPSQYPFRRICIQASRITRVQNPNFEKWELDIIYPNEIYPNDELTHLMRFEDPMALSCAAKEGKKDIVWLLLTRSDIGPDLNYGISGRTPLSQAAEKGHESIVKLLLERGAATDAKDKSGWTPLSWAAEKGHKSIMQQLLESGASVKTKDRPSRMLLLWAAVHNYEAILKLLLERGAPIETKDKYGRTPLSRAAEKGLESMVELLLERGAPIETKDKYGRTPLSWAAEKGHESMVELLLQKGAVIDAKDKSGWTPLSRAAEKGHVSMVELLLQKGAATDAMDKYGRTPLSRAAEKGHESMVELLLQKGAVIDAKDKSGWTPLSRAAEKGHVSMVELLLQKGAATDAMDKYGRTPLSRAAEKGHESIIELLLQKGAATDAIDKYGWTPLSWAAEKGHVSMVKLCIIKASMPGFNIDDGNQAFSQALKTKV